MNRNNPLAGQTGTPSPGTGRAIPQAGLAGIAVCEKQLVDQSVTPEQLSPSFLAACQEGADFNLLDQELEFLWEDGGAPGKFYEIYLGKLSRNPIIKSKTSGKFFALPWSVIIKLAVDNGIDS